MEMRVGDLVMVTARVMNQKARKVIKADTSRMTAEVKNPLRNHMFFLEVNFLPSITVRLRQINPQALYAIKLIWFPGKRSTMDSLTSASKIERG